MPKFLSLGNGNMLVLYDQYGQIKDLYFPYISRENQLGRGSVHRIGVYVDDQIFWLEHSSWDIHIDYQNESLASQVVARNEKIKVELVFEDVVYNERNIFLRRVHVKNLDTKKRTIKLFFNQQFEFFGTNWGNTGYYDPELGCIIHHKGRRVVIVNGRNGKKGFDQYSIGTYDKYSPNGTWRDAEDGELSHNPVEHGSVDSVIGFTLSVSGGKSASVEYWMAISKSLSDVRSMNDYVLSRGVHYLQKTTKDFWNAWVNKYDFTYQGLNDEVVRLFKHSLLAIRTHVDNNGAIIASCDAEMLQYGKDTYSYMWPRDGAFVSMALDQAGYFELSRKFFEFCNDVIEPDGYLRHKYEADRSLGSSWHPWVKDGKIRLAIQEDETAIVLFSLWEHYKVHRDLEFVEGIYNSLIKRAAEFLIEYRDKKTNLPLASYDLWEEVYGITPFTCSTVYGGLQAASRFADLLGKKDYAKKYQKAAEEVGNAMMKHLYNKKKKTFYRYIRNDGRKLIKDETVDASAPFAAFYFGVLKPDDPILKESYKAVMKHLWCKTDIGGIARYQGDKYYSVSDEMPGNPWFITYLWYAQYRIASAQEPKDLEDVVKIFEWTAKHATSAGLLSEQINPYTGEGLSVTPLTWSHAQYVLAVIEYLQRLEDFGVCVACNPVK